MFMYSSNPCGIMTGCGGGAYDDAALNVGVELFKEPHCDALLGLKVPKDQVDGLHHDFLDLCIRRHFGAALRWRWQKELTIEGEK